MADIQSAKAEIRRGKKEDRKTEEEEETTGQNTCGYLSLWPTLYYERQPHVIQRFDGKRNTVKQ